MRFLIAIAMLGTVACSEAETVSNIPEESAATARDVDAGGYAEKLKQAGLPVEDLVVVTEETDENNLLGRPNQYTSKVFFVDQRYRGEGMEPSEQNTIEVFATEADASKRREYIENIAAEMPIFSQYIIQSGPAVLRLDKTLSPSDARAYEAALGS